MDNTRKKAEETLWLVRLNQPRGITTEFAKKQREKLKKQYEIKNNLIRSIR